MRIRIRTFLLQWYHCPWGRILLSAVVTAAMLLLFSSVQEIAYLTNDDNAIAFTLAGYHTGTPSPYALFTNCILGYGVSGLYAILPRVAWWAVLQLVTVAVSAIAIGAALLREGAKRETPLMIPLMVHGALLLLLILTPFLEPTYTVTGAILGAAGAALILAAADEENEKTRVTLDALGLLAVTVAFLYREETGYAVLCFFAAAVLYRVLAALECGLAARRRAIQSAAVLCVAAAVLCGGAFALNRAMHARVNGAEYETFFIYRERFTDYPRPSYDEAPALYDSVGWDKSVYDLADYWCFLDERIESDALRTITESEQTHITLVDAVRVCVETIEADIPARLTAAALLLLFVTGLFCWQRNMRRWPAFAIETAVTLGAFLLCLLLCVRGRFLIRTFRVVATPAAVLCSLLVMRMAAPKADKQGRTLYTLLIALLLVVSGASALVSAKTLRVNSPKWLLNDSRAVHAYALQHPENVYIRDTFVINNVDAFTVYPTQKPTNLLSWGGCELYSAESERQWAVNGLVKRDAGVFFEDNVYFLTRVDSAEYAALSAYLATWHNAAGMTLVDTVTDGIGVYRVTY